MSQRNYNMVKCPEYIDADCDGWSTCSYRSFRYLVVDQSFR